MINLIVIAMQMHDNECNYKNIWGTRAICST
jgi:hypothetical protein